MPERKKNPRAPLIDVKQAIEYGIKIYEQALTNTIAQDIAGVALGYKDAQNGAVKTKLGTLKYYGILEGRGKGKVAVSEAIQDFKFAPNPSDKWEITRKLLSTPDVFNAITEQFDGKLPDDAVIKMFLLKEFGFAPDRADVVLKVFRSSIEYVNSLEPKELPSTENEALTNEDVLSPPPQEPIHLDSQAPPISHQPDALIQASDHDVIPIRLPKGRRAWLTIPNNFAESDKGVIKTQIDAIWVEE